jgi:hypothetical protein
MGVSLLPATSHYMECSSSKNLIIVVEIYSYYKKSASRGLWRAYRSSFHDDEKLGNQ